MVRKLKEKNLESTYKMLLAFWAAGLLAWTATTASVRESRFSSLFSGTHREQISYDKLSLVIITPPLLRASFAYFEIVLFKHKEREKINERVEQKTRKMKGGYCETRTYSQFVSLSRKDFSKFCSMRHHDIVNHLESANNALILPILFIEPNMKFLFEFRCCEVNVT
jgi:hypothetical protein